MKNNLQSVLCKFRILFCYAIFLLANLFFVFIAVFISLLSPFDKKCAKRAIDMSLQKILYALSFKIFPLLGGYTISARGLDNIRKRQAIFAINHISYLDPLFALALIPNAAIVVKGKYDSVLAIWILTRFFDFVSIGSGEREDIENAVGKIESLAKGGRNIVIFPEGTRSPNSRLGDFKSLAFKISRRAGLPIVPVAIVSSRPLLSRGTSLLPERAGVVFKLSILPALLPATFDSAKSLSSATYSEIARECRKLRSEFAKKP